MAGAAMSDEVTLADVEARLIYEDAPGTELREAEERAYDRFLQARDMLAEAVASEGVVHDEPN